MAVQVDVDKKGNIVKKDFDALEEQVAAQEDKMMIEEFKERLAYNMGEVGAPFSFFCLLVLLAFNCSLVASLFSGFLMLQMLTHPRGCLSAEDGTFDSTHANGCPKPCCC